VRIEKLAAIAEIVSAVAIVVTLGYLAIQTQQNTLAIQASVRQAMLDSDRAMLFLQAENPRIVIARDTDIDLTDEDVVRLATYLTAVVRVRENQWLQYQSGVIDERTWRTYRSAILPVFWTERTRSWWRNRSTTGEFDEGFVDMVNQLLVANPVRPDRTLRQALGFDAR
jgi:hypothetical protein